MNRFKNTSEAALYLWDHFYLANAPRPGDEKPWRLIENATGRIRESHSFLAASRPDVRLHHARRIVRAAGTCIRQLYRLQQLPDRRIVEALGQLEAEAQLLIDDVEGAASSPRIH
jgi:hypothetical protein